jgi:hypothetical protein
MQSPELRCPCMPATRLGRGRATRLHQTTLIPMAIPSWTGPPSDRQPSSTSTPCCTAFSSGIHRSRGSYHRPQLVHVASYSILPRPGASSVGNIPCLARLSRGIGSAIPANSACCSCCSFPDSCEREPATRLSRRPSPSATRPSSSYQVSHAACSLHLAS